MARKKLSDAEDRTRTDAHLPPPGASERPVPTLIVVQHPDPRRVGARRALRPGERLLLGRDEDALGPGALRDDRVSRRHAEVAWVDGVLALRDLESRNGSRVDGQPVAEAALVDQSIVGIGAVLILIRWAPPWTEPVDAPADLVAESAEMRQLLAELDRVAPLDSPVLITGETGVGKERIARELHRRSGRAGPLLAINCGGIDDTLLSSELFGHTRGAFSGAERARRGLIAEADEGTLLLDEIGEASAAMQASLLRVLQEGEVRPVGADRPVRVRTRFLAATLRDLHELVAQRAFREDLLARLGRWILQIPPLRARREDILPLARQVAARVLGRPALLETRLAEALLRQPWPRNTRELESVMERLAVHQRSAAVLDLLPIAGLSSEGPAALASGPPSPEHLRQLLLEVDLNIKAAADRLGVGRSTLYRWIHGAGIDLATLRGDAGPR